MHNCDCCLLDAGLALWCRDVSSDLNHLDTGIDGFRSLVSLLHLVASLVHLSGCHYETCQRPLLLVCISLIALLTVTVVVFYFIVAATLRSMLSKFVTFYSRFYSSG